MQAHLLEADDASRGPTVMAVHASPSHTFSKQPQPSIALLEGLGVLGDAHAGPTVQHRHDKRYNPNKPNLRQVHLLQSELFDDLLGQGFAIHAGQLGENITTRGVDILRLAEATRLHIGAQAVIEITGLRNPCVYIERFRKGLLAAVGARPGTPQHVRKTGVMGIVVHGGHVKAGDAIVVELPAGKHRPLKPV